MNFLRNYLSGRTDGRDAPAWASSQARGVLAAKATLLLAIDDLRRHVARDHSPRFVRGVGLGRVQDARRAYEEAWHETTRGQY